MSQFLRKIKNAVTGGGGKRRNALNESSKNQESRKELESPCNKSHCECKVCLSFLVAC